MARLAAIEKGLFYPTPERMVDLIAENVKVAWEAAEDRACRLLDPCAGEGVADRLAEKWGLESYGVEIHAGRAAKANRAMSRALHGSYHQLYTPPGSFSVLFLNPPYDEGEVVAEYSKSIRQEVQFLADTTQYLAAHGLLILIVPQHILRHHSFRSHMTNNFYACEVHRFPDPEFAAFSQVVVFAKRKNPKDSQYGYSHTSTDPDYILGERAYDGAASWLRGVDGQVRPLPLPVLDDKSFYFELRGLNPHAKAPRATGGCFATKKWRMLTGENDLCVFERPLIEPRPGHIAMLLAAGSVNGTEIAGKRLVKGSSEKIIVEGVDEDAGIEFKRERIVSRLSVLDLKSGEVENWRVDEKPEETKAWFKKHGATLANAVLRDHVPLYNGNITRLDFSGLTAPGTLPGFDKPTILDAQKRAATAVVLCWRDRKSVVVSGEMGTGKTTIGVCAATLAKFRKVIVMAPTHLVKKWLREAEKITGVPGVARTATKLSEVTAFFNDPHAKFLILSKERAKLGAKWAPAFARRKKRVTREVIVEEAEDDIWGRRVKDRVTEEITGTEDILCCPSCGEAIVHADGDGFVSEATLLEWLNKTKRSCRECEGALWTAKPISERGTARWPLAKFINDRFSNRYTLIVDEVHQYAHASSDQSRAMQLLGAGATKLLVMTGTLYGGRASSIFHLLYKVDPRFRDLYEYTDSPRFVHDHGLLETVHKLDEHTSTYGNRRNNSGGRVREIPGVNPAMLNLLLGYTVFLKLADLGYELPPFEEKVELIDHDPEVLSAAKAMAAEVKTVLREHPKILGQYLMACLGYPDCPEHAESIMSVPNNSWDKPVEIASAPAFLEQRWPKDEACVRIAKAEKKKGLKTLIFFTQTGKRSPVLRVKRFLEAAKLKVAVLDGDVSPDKREEWLAEHGGEFDVLLTNGRLVETGLDLLFATTIIQYGTEYSIHALRQSTRRSWRLGQTRKVTVIYLAYRGTMQEMAMQLIAKKMRAAELVDGDDLGGLAQHDVGGHDFLLELARKAADDAA